MADLRSADSSSVDTGGTPRPLPLLGERKPLCPEAGGGEGLKREGMREGSRGRRVLRRPWTEGLLRMGDRAAAVGSVFTASFFCLSSSGFLHILDAKMYQPKVRLWSTTPHAESRVATRSLGGCLGRNLREAHGGRGG